MATLLQPIRGSHRGLQLRHAAASGLREGLHRGEHDILSVFKPFKSKKEPDKRNKSIIFESVGFFTVNLLSSSHQDPVLRHRDRPQQRGLQHPGLHGQDQELAPVAIVSDPLHTQTGFRKTSILTTLGHGSLGI